MALAIENRLAYSNYNNVADVKAALKRSALTLVLREGEASVLASMMARRHLIAHRADVNERGGRGQHVATSITVTQVSDWCRVVETVGLRILTELDKGVP